MELPAHTGGSSAPPLEPDIYQARCHMMAYVGTQEDDYQGTVSERPKVVLGFTLPTEVYEFEEGQGEKPYQKSKAYTFSLGRKANLRRDLEKWRGQAWSEDWPDFDIEDVLGTAVRISTVQNEDGSRWYISDFIRAKKQSDCPPLTEAPISYDIRKHDEEAFQRLPKFVQDMAREAPEWHENDSDQPNATPQTEDHQVTEDDDDIPF